VHHSATASSSSDGVRDAARGVERELPMILHIPGGTFECQVQELTSRWSRNSADEISKELTLMNKKRTCSVRWLVLVVCASMGVAGV